MAKLLEDNDYDSSEDEDYVPSAADNLKADQEIAAMNKKALEEVKTEIDPEDFDDDLFDFLKEDNDKQKESTSNTEEQKEKSEESKEQNKDPEIESDDFVGRVQEFPGDIKATTIIPDERYSVKTMSDYCGELVDKEEEMSKKELDELIAKEASNSSRKRKALKVGGLGVVLQTLTKKKKMTMMEKTEQDWNKLVQKKGLESTLTAFQKGRKNVADHLSFAKNAR